MSDLLAPAQLRSELHRMGFVLQRRRGAFLFHRGDPGKGVFLVRKGSVTLQLDGAELLPSRRLGPGSILGLPATLAGTTYSLAAEVREDAELDFISREDLLTLMRKDSALCLQAMDLLSKEIASLRSVFVTCKPKKNAASN